MKAKRIVSILLTGSMLLSLLPVSALAAAPVFDAPAQTTAKKAAPLVQEADVSRSTEEEAATRSSRIWTQRTTPPKALPSIWTPKAIPQAKVTLPIGTTTQPPCS